MNKKFNSTARKSGRSIAVSNIISKFINSAKDNALDRASRIYSVEKGAGELRDLRVQLRKRDITISQASSGARILEKLQGIVLMRRSWIASSPIYTSILRDLNIQSRTLFKPV